MASIDITNPLIRAQVLQEIESTENEERKEKSLRDYEIYSDRLKPWVEDYLRGFYSTESISEMPIVASVNIAKRIVTKEAAIYSTAPKRTFLNVSDQQHEMLEKIYADLELDAVLLRANQFYKLENGQTHLYIFPSKGRLKARALMSHQLDVVPAIDDPETGDVYLISGFDRSSMNIKLEDFEDGQNQLIADIDDYKSTLKAKAVWSDFFNFVMDEEGNIVSADVKNELGITPIVDISTPKSGEYWVRSGSALTDFTVQFNAQMTDLSHIVRMQGFGQAWFKGPENLIPKNIKIGPNFVLKLAIDPNNPVETDFGFANANPDIEGSIRQLEVMLSSFLTSRGLDPKIVNGQGQADKFQSGFDRLLAMVEMFEPAKQDFSVFEAAEKRIFKIICAYLNVYGGTAILPEYGTQPFSAQADISVKFHEPQLIMSEQDRLQIIRDKLELGLMSKAESIAYDRGISVEEAKKVMAEIALDEVMSVGTQTNNALQVEDSAED